MTDRISPLSTPAATRAVLEAHGLATKKSLGQNFLVNDDVLRRILELSEVGADDVVLEVGPGIGTLTIPLLKAARAVVSVERDRDLPSVLRGTCGPWGEKFSLVEKDAVDLTEADVRVALACPIAAHGMAGAESAREGDEPGRGSKPAEPSAPISAEGADAVGAVPLPNKFVANLPYAVAATVVLGYFQDFAWLDSATVMVQAEVADRMCAQPGSKNYGAYTVKLSLYAKPAGRFSVSSGNFFPPPHVDSSVLRLDRRDLAEDGIALSPDELRATCTMADAAFASRRKTLANSCKTYFSGRGPEGKRIARELPELFAEAGIDPARRGETLSLEEFARLGRALHRVLS